MGRTSVAAASACYIVDLRAEGPERDDLRFFTNQLLGTVAAGAPMAPVMWS